MQKLISQRSAGSCTRSNAFPEDDYVRLCLNTDSLTSNDFLTKHVKNRMIFFLYWAKNSSEIKIYSIIVFYFAHLCLPFLWVTTFLCKSFIANISYMGLFLLMNCFETGFHHFLCHKRFFTYWALYSFLS